MAERSYSSFVKAGSKRAMETLKNADGCSRQDEMFLRSVSRSKFAAGTTELHRGKPEIKVISIDQIKGLR